VASTFNFNSQSMTRAWSKVFPDQSMTLAAIARLVHHATIAIRARKVHRHHDHDGTDGAKTA
jgi:hypothetical protein